MRPAGAAASQVVGQTPQRVQVSTEGQGAVERESCAIILADTWPEKIGKGLVFISLNLEPGAQVAALDALRAELESKGVAVKEGSWGYQILVVDDLDGNQLFFNYPSENPSGKD